MVINMYNQSEGLFVNAFGVAFERVMNCKIEKIYERFEKPDFNVHTVVAALNFHGDSAGILLMIIENDLVEKTVDAIYERFGFPKGMLPNNLVFSEVLNIFAGNLSTYLAGVSEIFIIDSPETKFDEDDYSEKGYIISIESNNGFLIKYGLFY